MSDNTLVFRAASRNDASALVQLLKNANLPSDGVQEMLAQDASQFVLATTATDVLAAGGIEVCGDYALLRSVAVRDDWQRKGLGEEIVKRAVNHAQTRGIHALYLLTTTAEHYFPRFGFEVISRDDVPSEIAGTVEFTSACPSSATVMSKALTPRK